MRRFIHQINLNHESSSMSADFWLYRFPAPLEIDRPSIQSGRPAVSTQVYCGGPIKKFQRFFGCEAIRKCLEITLDLKPKGKRRWPFGFEILKKFRYPWNYPVPPEYRDPPEFTETIDLKRSAEK